MEKFYYNTSKATKYIIIPVLSFILFIQFSWPETFVYTPIQGSNREQYFIHIIYRGKNADSGGK